MKRFFLHYKILILFSIGFIIFILLRIPSLYEPHYYVDEGMYASAGSMIRHGRIFYREIYDHKLPGMFYLYALFGTANQLMVAKIISIFMGLISMAGVYSLMKRLFTWKHAMISFFTVGILLGLPTFEGNVANAELFYIPFVIWGLYFGIPKIIKTSDMSSSWQSVLSGCLFGLALLIKFHPIFNFLMLVFFISSTLFKNNFNWKNLFSKRLIYLFIGFIVVIFIWIAFELLQGNLINFWQVAFVDAFSYAGTQILYKEKLLSLISNSNFRIIVAFIATLFVATMYFKNKISRSIYLISLLFIADVFGAFLSGRRYRHYLLPVLVSFSYFVGYVVGEVKSGRMVEKIRAILLLVVMVFGVSAYFIYCLSFGYDEEQYVQHAHTDDLKLEIEYLVEIKTQKYYQNFWDYYKVRLLDSKEYASTFSNAENRLSALKLHTDQFENGKVYIYSDSGWAYAYTDKYCPTKVFVAFQLFYPGNKKYRDEVVGDLRDAEIQLIIIDKRIEPFADLGNYIEHEFKEYDEDEYFLYFIRVPV